MGAWALLFGAAFLATVLGRRSTDASTPPPSRTVDPAAEALEREESLMRKVSALREESGRLLERRSAPSTPEAPAAEGAIRQQIDAAEKAEQDRDLEVLRRFELRTRLEDARKHLRMNPAQLDEYKRRMEAFVEKNDPDGYLDNEKVDREVLIPFLDRDQFARYEELRRKKAADMEEYLRDAAKAGVKEVVGSLEVDAGTADLIFKFRKEAVEKHQKAVNYLIACPDDGLGTLKIYGDAADSLRLQARPVLAPEVFDKFDRYLRNHEKDLRTLVAELKQTP